MKEQFFKAKEWIARLLDHPKSTKVEEPSFNLEEMRLVIYLTLELGSRGITPEEVFPEVERRLRLYHDTKSMKMIGVTGEMYDTYQTVEPDFEWSGAEMECAEMNVSSEDVSSEVVAPKSSSSKESATTTPIIIREQAAKAPEGAALPPIPLDDDEEQTTSKRDQLLGTMIKKLVLYLGTHHLLRYNVLSDITELGQRVDNEIVYQPITDRQVNTICIQAQAAGVGCLDRDVNRCIRSEYVGTYHPFKQYIDTLPAWDGIDRVTPLAQRVSHKEHWVNFFHIWMRGMMAQWMGLFHQGDGVSHAHTLAPILISPIQGCGKSTFCKSLLPKELSLYYTDSFEVLNNSACDKSMAKCGLINLDEFDSLTKQGVIHLKNHMQKTVLTYRMGNQKQATVAPRLASFIGTTNQREIMTDPTGSRRFICVEVEGLIDNNTPIDHLQLYAQLKQELQSGASYWLSKEEEKQLEQDNRAFYHRSQEEEIFFSLYRFATPEEEGAVYLSSTQIYNSMLQHHRSVLKPKGSNPFAKLLSSYQKPKKTSAANMYCVVKL
jgi:hypothetical protein